MKPVITVRRFEDHDNHQVQSVIRNFVLSRFSAAFWFCLFREVKFKVLKIDIFNMNCFVLDHIAAHSLSHCRLFHLLWHSTGVLCFIGADSRLADSR